MAALPIALSWMLGALLPGAVWLGWSLHCSRRLHRAEQAERQRTAQLLADAEGRHAELQARLEARVAARTEALQASEARMRTIFSTSFQYQGLLALDGSLLDANETSLRGIGATLDEVVGRPYWDSPWFARTPGMPETIRLAVQAAAQGHSRRQELRLLLPAGWRQFDFAVRPVHDRDGAVVAVVPEAIDITERHLAEERLRQAQKMEAVGQLTGGVAHDFNNLLQVISANLHLVSRLTHDDVKVMQRLDSASAAVRRGAKLASQLLAFGRRQALAPRVVDVGRFIGGIEDLLRRSIGEGVEVELIVSGGLWHTFIDPTQVENALLNLAINARDAMDGNGRLTIEVGNAFLDDDYVRGQVDVKPGQYVMLAVSDTGCGMTPQVLSQVFQPFFSTKPAGAGTGLGLSMVYGFVRQSGGHVKIYSEPGQGTTVKVYLPRARAAEGEVDATPDPGAAAAADDAGGGAETVLVVEDDAAVRGATVEMLQELGYRVLKASDADQALVVIDDAVAHHAAIDLLFTDVVMPGRLKSPELADKARQRLPGIAVLFTSGYAQNAIVHGGRLDPGVELLSKPYSARALASKVRAVLDHGVREPQ
ncbi:ATP-binding protein [Rhizobacter sp. OV335]|uniref:ATP-binding protein n=1 Tax=Rhizobacter sp. OV335 TaxID=1500264 RepID=UPI000913B811|nr:ATP-binding protein [Rhizobacter sp. OV335]SHN34113.1 PAS domain S-box-containing protein [Rhizobacter sp. OV335]